MASAWLVAIVRKTAKTGTPLAPGVLTRVRSAEGLKLVPPDVHAGSEVLPARVNDVPIYHRTFRDDSFWICRRRHQSRVVNVSDTNGDKKADDNSKQSPHNDLPEGECLTNV
jgi:hypothetical protein